MPPKPPKISPATWRGLQRAALARGQGERAEYFRQRAADAESKHRAVQRSRASLVEKRGSAGRKSRQVPAMTGRMWPAEGQDDGAR
jgi:hypothetical protein